MESTARAPRDRAEERGAVVSQHVRRTTERTYPAENAELMMARAVLNTKR
jgi:hypothetical protein